MLSVNCPAAWCTNNYTVIEMVSSNLGGCGEIEIQLLMQQKLIVTLWKAQFKDIEKDILPYCRLTYNNQERNSKTTSQSKNFAWKQTFIFPLAKKISSLKLDFISLKDGQQIHFAKDNVAQSMSFGSASVEVQVESLHHGSEPCKMDIFNKKDESIGKIFIEYEIIKTEVAYTVQKQMDYFYLLKMTNFRVNFVRNLKRTPKFYLYFLIEGREHKQALPFEQQVGGGFVYNYPVKLYLKKQIDMQIQLIVKDQEEYTVELNQYQTETSFNQSVTTQKKTNKSSGKKDKILLELGKEKISGNMDLNFKKDAKLSKKISLSTLVKSQKRQIGVMQFQAEVIFKSKEQLQYLQEQKKGLSPHKDSTSLQRKKSVVKQSNGIIIVNSILGRLQLFNESMIQNKNMSIDLKLGKQTQESSVLQRPGKELIIIDTFSFKRTWEQTMKININLINNNNEKIPYFFAEVNLRDLFDMGRYASKKVKLRDENKNYSGQLTLDMAYKEQQQKKSPSIAPKESLVELSMPQQELEQLKLKLKRSQIEQRIKKRQDQRAKSKQIYSMSTLAVLQENQIMLPPLKSASRMQTLSPKNDKHKVLLINAKGNIKFTRSPRFQSSQRPGYQSYNYVRQSDFDSRKKKGPYIGYGNKHDFVKPYVENPGVGRYEMPSVWDKYK